MTVQSWEPASAATLDTATVARLCRAAERIDEPTFGFAEREVAALAACARDGGAGSPVDWSALASTLDDHRLLALIRLFTRAEMAFPAWKAGDRSPVIALAAELKRRGGLPAGLTAWIRANSDNRFLPHGSLLHRL